MPVIIAGPGQDVIPATDEDAAAWFVNFSAEFSVAAWGLDLTAYATLEDLSEAFTAALLAATNPNTRTTATVAAKDAARTAAAAQFRPAAQAALSWWRAGNATDAALLVLGLRVPKTTRTRIEAPVDAPLIDIPSVAPGVINVRLTQVVDGAAVTDRAFPPGVYAIELYARTGTEPFSLRQVIRRVNIGTPVADLANGVIYDWCARYINPRGERGPMSTTVAAPVWNPA